MAEGGTNKKLEQKKAMGTGRGRDGGGCEREIIQKGNVVRKNNDKDKTKKKGGRKKWRKKGGKKVLEQKKATVP